MAEVKPSVQQDIDKLLDLLTWQWSRVPEVEREKVMVTAPPPPPLGLLRAIRARTEAP